MDKREDQKKRVTDAKFLRGLTEPLDVRISKNTQVKDAEEFSKEMLQNLFKKYLSYEKNSRRQNINIPIVEGLKLKKVSNTQVKFPMFQSIKQRIGKIMVKGYNLEDLKLAEFNQIQSIFKLNSNSIKMMCQFDPIILQILRYVIYNKQQIPNYFVRVINQMANTNITKQWGDGGNFLGIKTNMLKIIEEQFQPPLDLYLQFVDTGLIKPHQQQLIEVLVRNQFLFRSIVNKKKLYPTLSQKKRLILNQFPYLLDLFDRINSKDSTCFNLQELKSYLNEILGQFQFPNEENLLQRYLPEIKCRYLKLKPELNSSDLDILFVSLKSVQSLDSQDFKILYRTGPNKTPISQQYEVKTWSEFWKISQLCQNKFTKKQFYLTTKWFQFLNERLNFQKCTPDNIIQINLIFAMLREQSYQSQLFPKPLVRSLSYIFRNIPDKKKIKQTGYILLMQYKKLVYQNPQRRADIMREYTIPQLQLDDILDEGRQIALDLLLSKEQTLNFSEQKYLEYSKILKRVINETRNKMIKSKATELSKKIDKLNKFQSKDLKFYEQNLASWNEFIEFIQSQTKKGEVVSIQCIKDILIILEKRDQASLRRSCLSTLRYIVNNKKKGQLFPQKFEENVAELIRNLYYEENISEEFKDQIIKLAVICTYYINTYQFIQSWSNFFMQAYLKSPVNSSLNINSSYGLYSLAMNVNQINESYNSAGKKLFDTFQNKILKRSTKDQFDLNINGNINILCGIAVFAKNEVLLSSELVEQLTLIALKNKKFTEVALIPIYFLTKNPKSRPLSQKSLLNICQILKKNENNQIFGVYILQNYFKTNLSFPTDVNNKIEELVRIEKCLNSPCEQLCLFYKIKVKKQVNQVKIMQDIEEQN